MLLFVIERNVDLRDRWLLEEGSRGLSRIDSVRESSQEDEVERNYQLDDVEEKRDHFS